MLLQNFSRYINQVNCYCSRINSWGGNSQQEGDNAQLGGDQGWYLDQPLVKSFVKPQF